MPTIDRNPQSSAPIASPRPTSEDADRRLEERERVTEHPFHDALREALGEDDLPKESRYSNASHVQPYVTKHDPIRDHLLDPQRDKRETVVHDEGS